MHVLIGLSIIAGLIAIGFRGGTARAFVRGIIYCAAAAVLAACYGVAVEMYRTTPDIAQGTKITAQFDLTKDFEVALVRKCMAHYDFDRDHQSQCVAAATKEFYAFKQAEQVSR
jgi:hypothetical protein